jgi:hypothetical protein
MLKKIAKNTQEESSENDAFRSSIGSSAQSLCGGGPKGIAIATPGGRHGRQTNTPA